MHSANSKAFDVSGEGTVNNEKLVDPLVTQAIQLCISPLAFSDVMPLSLFTYLF
jgi:hypothetical protein